MEGELPSLVQLVLLELGVVAATALATWRYAVHHFRGESRPSEIGRGSSHRSESVEEALDRITAELERLDDDQQFVQDYVAKRLAEHIRHTPPTPVPS